MPDCGRIPLQAIDDDIARNEKDKITEPENLREFDTLLAQIRQQEVAPKVLAVMLTGLPYAEAAESRLRTRLAIVSGLRASRDTFQTMGNTSATRW